MFCPKCKAEFVSGETLCKECNVALVDKLPRKEDESLNLAEYEELLIVRDMASVAFIRSALDSAGIAYVFPGDTAAYVPLLVPARLFVKKDDVTLARDLLKDFL